MNEAELRKPGWVEGVWIRLHDGKSWSFPRPKLIEVALDFSGGGRPRIGGSAPIPSFGAAYFEKLEAALAAEEPLDQIQQFAWLAADLLKMNYELSDDELSDLLPYVVDEDTGEWDAANRESWQAIVNVAAGIAGPAGRTRVRWARLAAIMATGHVGPGLSLEDGNDLASILVESGRFPASNTWVGREIDAADEARTAASLDGLL